MQLTYPLRIKLNVPRELTMNNYSTIAGSGHYFDIRPRNSSLVMSFPPKDLVTGVTI